MISYRIKRALLKDVDCFFTNEWVLTNLQDLLDETIDFLDYEGYYVVLDKKIEK